jgi:hypothetical protein
VNLFFNGELSEPVRKLKYHGNSIVTFLKLALHHLCRDYGLSAEQILYCLQGANITADYYALCEPYDSVDCDTVQTM